MKMVMLFPGYGSQFVTMAKELYDESRTIQEYFEEASNCLGINFVKLCFASSDTELAKMTNAYTATFLVSSALFALLKEEGIMPDAVAGYNLGEYSAIHAMGGFSFPDGLYLLNKYVGFYREALEGMEVAALHIKKVPTHELEALCLKATKGDSKVRIALYNTEKDNIIAGHVDALEHVRDWVTQGYEKAKIEDVDLGIGLHSDYMDQVVKNFTIYLEKVDFNDLAAPLFVDDQVIQKGADIKYRVIEHIHTPILWTAVMNNLADYDLIIEVGPGTVLSKMAKEKYPDKLIYAVNRRSDINQLKEILGLAVKDPEQSEESEPGETDGSI